MDPYGLEEIDDRDDLGPLIGLTVYYCYPERKLPPNTAIDRLKVYKSKRKMAAYSNGRLVKMYRIALGRNPIGHKVCEGDKRTPKGTYRIDGKNPNSGYHKNLGISYPNDSERAYAQSLCKLPGGDIKIHGLRNGSGAIGKFHRWKDWTMGCIAVTDSEMDERYEAVQLGAEIEIVK